MNLILQKQIKTTQHTQAQFCRRLSIPLKTTSLLKFMLPSTSLGISIMDSRAHIDPITTSTHTKTRGTHIKQIVDDLKHLSPATANNKENKASIIATSIIAALILAISTIAIYNIAPHCTVAPRLTTPSNHLAASRLHRTSILAAKPVSSTTILSLICAPR